MTGNQGPHPAYVQCNWGASLGRYWVHLRLRSLLFPGFSGSGRPFGLFQRLFYCSCAEYIVGTGKGLEMRHNLAIPSVRILCYVLMSCNFQGNIFVLAFTVCVPVALCVCAYA